MRLGLGMRPSATIWSNFVAETPMYSAACPRQRPRGSVPTGSVVRLGTVRSDIGCSWLEGTQNRAQRLRLRQAYSERNFTQPTHCRYFGDGVLRDELAGPACGPIEPIVPVTLRGARHEPHQRLDVAAF